MNKFVFCLTALMLLDCSTVDAQMFGHARTVGRPLSSRSGPSSQEDVGTLTGSERFLRGNRGRAAFVGADQTEGQSFVGSQQARTSGTIVSSIAGMTPTQDQSRQINQPLAVAPAGTISLPKLRLNIPNATAEQDTRLNNAVIRRIQKAMSLVSQTEIGVSVEGRTATLRGLVRSDEERRLAETLASFEPGISSVHNLLQTEPSPSHRPLPGPR